MYRSVTLQLAGFMQIGLHRKTTAQSRHHKYYGLVMAGHSCCTQTWAQVIYAGSMFGVGLTYLAIGHSNVYIEQANVIL